MMAEVLIDRYTDEHKVANQLMTQRVVDIHVASGVAESLDIFPDTIKDNILLNSWIGPSFESRNRIPARGDTQRSDVGSATLVLKNGSGNPHLVDVVAKDVKDPEAALKEQETLERVQSETTVRAVRPFAVIESLVGGNNCAWILTLLEKGVVPVGKLRFESFYPGQKQSFTNELARFMVDAAEQGVMHQDARLRNIGYDLTQRPFIDSHRSDFLFFDMETSRVVDRDTIKAMHNPNHQPTVVTAGQYHAINERYLDDAADTFEDLNQKHRLTKDYLKKEFAQVYLDGRQFSWGQRSDKSSLVHILSRRFVLD